MVARAGPGCPGGLPRRWRQRPLIRSGARRASIASAIPFFFGRDGEKIRAVARRARKSVSCPSGHLRLTPFGSASLATRQRKEEVATGKGAAASGWQTSRTSVTGGSIVTGAALSCWRRRGNNVILSKTTSSPLPVLAVEGVTRLFCQKQHPFPFLLAAEG